MKGWDTSYMNAIINPTDARIMTIFRFGKNNKSYIL